MSPADVALSACVGTLARELIAAPLVIDPVAEAIAYLDYERSIAVQLCAMRFMRREARK